ncbi:MAG TPA: hypothetical protein PKM51_04755 [Chitinophagales bacterium]|mgnify:CR=1 FL=1|nr:hypothetical protein [Chitinophagales bacterium]HNM32038.1 hypothetical protein [Chitinophagales bacterium]
MAKVLTLRNIITLTVLVFFTSCENSKSNKDQLRSISSEDKQYSDITSVQVVVDPSGSGQTVYVVRNK